MLQILSCLDRWTLSFQFCQHREKVMKLEQHVATSPCLRL